MREVIVKYLRSIAKKYPPEHEIFDIKLFGVRLHAFFDDGTFFLYGMRNGYMWFRFSPEAGNLSRKDME